MSLTVEEVARRKLHVVETCFDHMDLNVNDACYCDKCPENASCEFAFDPYNWSEHDDWCLAEK